jgi:hypothetical protein
MMVDLEYAFANFRAVSIEIGIAFLSISHMLGTFDVLYMVSILPLVPLSYDEIWESIPFK